MIDSPARARRGYGIEPLHRMKSTEPKRLYQSVAAQIVALIRQGEFAAGERLPPERELALKLGVSRPSLREALIALEIGGQIEIRMGSGVYVRDAPADAVGTMVTLGDSPSELMQARAAIEGSVAALAAARMTAAMLERLRRAVQRMKRLAAAGRSPVEADRQFHMLIAEAAGNSVLTRFVGELFDSRHDSDRGGDARPFGKARKPGRPPCTNTKTSCARCRPAIRSPRRRRSARIFARPRNGGSTAA
ncbi:regulator for uxu operon [Burkholderia dolosa AU0158]|nr:regulator for uxu operon [Burkholderia dolosa AU0158]